MSTWGSCSRWGHQSTDRYRLAAGIDNVRASTIFGTPPLLPAGKFQQPRRSEMEGESKRAREWRRKYRTLFHNPDREHCAKFAAYLKTL
jgi:hypothetical protein